MSFIKIISHNFLGMNHMKMRNIKRHLDLSVYIFISQMLLCLYDFYHI